MKTTVEIADPLLDAARKLATRKGVTLRTLIERGLSHVLKETKASPPFKLRRAGFGGNGLQAEFRDASWDTLREAAYQGRGG